MTEVPAVAVITVLAVIAPGADFAMVVRGSYLHGRRTGLLAALGVAAGVLVHVTYTMLGVGLLIASSTFLFTVIKLAGAAYLVYIGVRTFRTRGEFTVDLENRTGLTPFAALRTGFLTNVLNPKTTLFVVSTFAQVVSPGTPVLQQVGYGLFMSLAHLLWFGVNRLGGDVPPPSGPTRRLHARRGPPRRRRKPCRRAASGRPRTRRTEPPRVAPPVRDGLPGGEAATASASRPCATRRRGHAGAVPEHRCEGFVRDRSGQSHRGPSAAGRDYRRSRDAGEVPT